MAILSRLVRLGNHGSITRHMVIKRWSGHNAMDIAPSANFCYRYTHNWMHFYLILAAVPIITITAIVDIRSNPELIEAPDGYEPRYWEYHKNPITRFIARYMFNSVELDREVHMANKDFIGEELIRGKVIKKCEKVMSFYNDHRSLYFIPYYAEYYRTGRDMAEFQWNFEKTELSEVVELAYDPRVRPVVPVEGFVVSSSPKE